MQARTSLLLLTLALVSSQVRSQDVVSVQCARDVASMLAAAEAGELWALHMVDASAKLPDGILWGHTDHMGNYDECVNARRGESEAAFQPRYCRVNLGLAAQSGLLHLASEQRSLPQGVTLPLRVAACLPDSCSLDDIRVLAEQRLPDILESLLGAPLNISASVDEKYCSKQESSLSVWCWLVLALMVLLSALVVLATVLASSDDRYAPLRSLVSRDSLFVRAFCWQGISTRLFSQEPGTLGCLHGMRALSMAWIILGHRYELAMRTPLSNALAGIDKVVRQPLDMTVVQALLAVDTFFFLSGFLVCYVFLRQMSRDSNFNVVKFYVYRYLRLSLPLALVVLFYLTLMSHTADGPNWEPFIGYFRQSCEEYWWAAMLYVNNFVAIFQECVEQTWYVSADMQMAWVAPLFLLPLHFVPRAGVQLLLLMTAITCFLPFTMTYLYNYPWSVDLVNPFYDGPGFTSYIYLPFYSRMAPYLVGILCAYFLYQLRGKKLQLPRWQVAAGWILSAATCLTVMYTLHIPYKPGHTKDSLAAAFYAGFHRMGWAVGLSWIPFACVQGRGGAAARVLEWRGFVSLSKLTYCAFLTHYLVISAHTASFRTSYHISHYEAVRSFFGYIPIVVTCSLWLHVTVESPSLVILRHIFAKDNAAKKQVDEITAPAGKKVES